jgi:hypothetical protein
MTDMHKEIEVTSQQELFSSVDEEQLVKLAKQLSEDKRSHFLYLMTSLLDCYQDEDGKAVVIVKSDEGQLSMAAVNANEIEVDGMVGLVSEAIKARSRAIAQGQIN